MMLCIKALVFLALYLLRQGIFRKKIRLQHIMLTMVLALYTKPILEDLWHDSIH